MFLFHSQRQRKWLSVPSYGWWNGSVRVPLESWAGHAPLNLTAPSRPIVLHGKRMPRAITRASAAGVGWQQLHHDVRDDGICVSYVYDAPATQPDPRCGQTSAQSSRPWRCSPYTSKNLINTCRGDLFIPSGRCHLWIPVICIINTELWYNTDSTCINVSSWVSYLHINDFH